MENVYIIIARYSQKNDLMISCQNNQYFHFCEINRQHKRESRKKRVLENPYQFPKLNNVLKISNYSEF